MPERTVVSAGHCNKRKCDLRKKRMVKKSVIKMLAVMDQQSAGPSSTSIEDAPRTPETSAQNDEFLQTGRTGRRNALPDILNHQALVTTSDLPVKMGTLSTEDKLVPNATPNLPHINPGPSSS